MLGRGAVVVVGFAVVGGGLGAAVGVGAGLAVVAGAGLAVVAGAAVVGAAVVGAAVVGAAAVLVARSAVFFSSDEPAPAAMPPITKTPTTPRAIHLPLPFFLGAGAGD